MIVGHGNIARVLNDFPQAIFFASGVSNSQCINVGEFNREQALLREYFDEGKDKMLVYFSSISVNFLHTPYTNHKLHMEHLVKRWFPNYCIIRLGNISWDTNPNTFVNYLRAHPDAVIKDEYRYMVDEKTLLLVTDNLPLTGQHEITITSTIKKVKEYV